jgi:hypothetical protein
MQAFDGCACVVVVGELDVAGAPVLAEATD